MALEFLRGGELFDRILSLKHYSEKTASNIVQDMIRPIIYLHEKNICHLDLKPENFVLGMPDDDKTIKLIDFGLALRVDEDKDDYPTCGTKIYKSPEMADPYFKRSPAVLKKSDAYSFGIVLYTMLVGRFPAFGSKGLKFPNEAELSNDAKDLLRRLTEKNYIMRLSLHDAMSHPWVTGESAPDIPLKNTVINGLKNYRFMNIFQRAVVNIVSNRLTDEDKLALKEAFTALDVNGDGKLDLGEISKLFQDHKKQLGLETDKAALERAKSLYLKMDHNNDGAVDAEEFMEVQVLGSLLGKDSELQMDLKTLFNVIDVNNDGDISVDEFAAFMANFQPQEVQSIFNSADRDHSGTINFEEFMSAMSGYVQSNTEQSRYKISNAVDVIKSHKKLPDRPPYSPEEKEDEQDRLLAGKA